MSAALRFQAFGLSAFMIESWHANAVNVALAGDAKKCVNRRVRADERVTLFDND
jgi:hypothetical protein